MVIVVADMLAVACDLKIYETCSWNVGSISRNREALRAGVERRQYREKRLRGWFRRESNQGESKEMVVDRGFSG